MSQEKINNIFDLRIENLAKTYAIGFFRKKIKAVRDVSLTVERGEIFGLLGPNGAGKTTTIKILMGLVRPTSGRVEILGRQVADIKAKQLIGYLPESPYFYEYLTGRELLYFVAELFGIDKATRLRRTEELLEKVGMTHAADLALRRYSKGMLQRIGVAQALINEPKLAILDEPLTGLDPIGRKQLRDIIVDLRNKKTTVVISSHILSDVELLADRVAILVKGKTVDVGPLHKLLDPKIINTEIVVQNANTELLETLEKTNCNIKNIADLTTISLEGNKSIDATVDLIRKHDGKILSVVPRKESLEDVVVRRAMSDEKQ